MTFGSNVPRVHYDESGRDVTVRTDMSFSALHSPGPDATKRIWWAASAILMAVILLVVPEASAQTTDRELNLATFDQVWQAIERTYWEPDELDWDEVRSELRPQAEQAEDLEALRAVLHEMIGRIGLSHFGILPASSAAAEERTEVEDGDGEGIDGRCDPEDRMRLLASVETGGSYAGETGIQAASVEGEMVVLHVEPGSPADRAEIRSGETLFSIDGIRTAAIPTCLSRDGDVADHGEDEDDGENDERAARQLIRSALSGLLAGEPGTVLEVEVSTGDDTSSAARRTVELRRELPEGTEVVSWGNLTDLPVHFSWQSVSPELPQVAWIRFNIWMLPVSRAFEQNAKALAHTDAVVLDLRGNPGGIGGLSMGIAGFFIDEKVSLGSLHSRDATLEFRVNPRRVNNAGERLEIFAGPVAILVDGATASTSEIFAAGFQDLGRARVFGERTMAAALPSLVEKLPTGDLFQYAVADFVRPSGERVEGVGVMPDEVVKRTREGLLRGRDEPLAAALTWIHEQLESAAQAPP